jgi:hypothetical protein
MIDYTVQTIDTAFSDLQAMIPAQWLHTGDRETDCQPNWMLYRDIEARGGLLLVVAREDDRPIGYLVAFIYPHVNAVHEKVAEIPTYYAEKGRAHILNSMIDYALDQLSIRGVFRVDSSTNAEFSAGRLWELKGFKLKKLGYSLTLKKAEGVPYA